MKVTLYNPNASSPNHRNWIQEDKTAAEVYQIAKGLVVRILDRQKDLADHQLHLGELTKDLNEFRLDITAAMVTGEESLQFLQDRYEFLTETVARGQSIEYGIAQAITQAKTELRVLLSDLVPVGEWVFILPSVTMRASLDEQDDEGYRALVLMTNEEALASAAKKKEEDK